MLIGYARISTVEQTLDLQKDALKVAGCEKIFSDVASGARTERPGLNQAIEFCRKGDTLVCGRARSHILAGEMPAPEGWPATG